MNPLHPVRAGLVFLSILCASALAAASAVADPIGSVTRLPLPRFASLKTDRVNLREGPSKDHATKWVYERAGLPVESPPSRSASFSRLDSRLWPRSLRSRGRARVRRL